MVNKVLWQLVLAKHQRHFMLLFPLMWCTYLCSSVSVTFDHLCLDVSFTKGTREGRHTITNRRIDITKQDHYLNIWQPWAEARYEVRMVSCVGKERRRRWKEWKRIEWVGVCSWLTDQIGDSQETHRPAHSLFLWPAILLCLHPSFIHSIPPSPSSLLPGPRATWVGCSDLYLCACVCVVCEVMTLSHRLHLAAYKRITNLLEFLIIDIRLPANIFHLEEHSNERIFFSSYHFTTLVSFSYIVKGPV